MKRILLAFFTLTYLITANVQPARADKEAVQKVLKKADRYEKIGMNALEEGIKIQKQFEKYANGIQGALKFAKAVASGDLEGALAAAENVPGLSGEVANLNANLEGATNLVNEGVSAGAGLVNKANGLVSKANGLIDSPVDALKNAIPSDLSNINDVGQTQKDVDKSYTAEYGSAEDIEVYSAQKEKLDAIQRDNIASLYARALAARVEITKEKAETPEEIDSENTRALIAATRNAATRAAVRLRRIVQLEASIQEYESTQLSKIFMTTVQKQEEE